MNVRLMRFIGLVIIPCAVFAMNQDPMSDRDQMVFKRRKLPHPELLKGRLSLQGLDKLIKHTDVIEKLSGKEKNLPAIRFDIGCIITAYDIYRRQNGKRKLSRVGAACVGIGIFEACLEDDEDILILRGLLKKLKWDQF